MKNSENSFQKSLLIKEYYPSTVYSKNRISSKARTFTYHLNGHLIIDRKNDLEELIVEKCLPAVSNFLAAGTSFVGDHFSMGWAGVGH